MDFYEALWRFVRVPEELVEYARGLGMYLGTPPEDFGDRLLFVARNIVHIMEVEASDVPQFVERCMGAMRFLRDVRVDAPYYGLNVRDIEDLEARMRLICRKGVKRK